jgi:hypothetical protein
LRGSCEPWPSRHIRPGPSRLGVRRRGVRAFVRHRPTARPLRLDATTRSAPASPARAAWISVNPIDRPVCARTAATVSQVAGGSPLSDGLPKLEGIVPSPRAAIAAQPPLDDVSLTKANTRHNGRSPDMGDLVCSARGGLGSVVSPAGASISSRSRVTVAPLAPNECTPCQHGMTNRWRQLTNNGDATAWSSSKIGHRPLAKCHVKQFLGLDRLH